MENFATQVSTVLGNLGGSVLVMIVMFVLGLVFHAGFSKSLGAVFIPASALQV